MRSTNMDRKTLISTKYSNLYYYKQDGVYHHFLRFYHDGKSYKKKISIGRTHKDAYNIALKTKARILEDKANKEIETFGNLFRRMVAKAKHYKDKQYEYNVTSMFNKHFDAFKDKQLHTITLDELQDFINDKLEQLSVSSAFQLKRIIIDTYKQSKVVENLGNFIVLPKTDNARYFDMPIDDAKKLYKAINSYPDVIYRSLFMFGLYGRRKGEIAYLQWDDIDLKNKRYYIRPEISKTRTHAIYNLTDEHVKTINQIPVQSDYIHVNLNNKPLYYFSKRWRKLLKDIGVEYIRFHDLRHLIGYIAVNEGYSLEQIGKALGHKSTQTTKRYSRVKEEMASVVVNAVHDILK